MRLIHIAAAVAALVGTSARADALLDQVMPAIKADGITKWNLARAFQSFDKNGKAERTSFARLEGGKWSLVAYAGAKPTDDVLKSFNERAAQGKIPYPRYAVLEKILAANPVVAQSTDALTIYKIRNLPPKSIEFQDEDLSKYVVAEVTVTKGSLPYVSKLRVYNEAPFRMSLAKVEKAEKTLTFALLTNSLGAPASATPVAVTEETNAKASALFQSILFHQKITLSEYKLPAK